MNSLSKKVKTDISVVFCLIALLSIASCSTSSRPDCNYSENISATEQIRDFVWRDKKHATFHKDWLQSSQLEISKRYQYLQRKALPDAIQAKNEIIWLESKLNNLGEINNSLLTQIEMNRCYDQQASQSVLVLKQQNAGIDYIRSALPEIANDIETKTQKIIDATESK